MKKKWIVFLLTALFFLTACQKTPDISGSYSIVGMDNVYTFTSDGKILTNDEIESEARYKIKGGKILTYVDGYENEALELPFEITENGFKIGEAEYVRLAEYDEVSQDNEANAES